MLTDALSLYMIIMHSQVCDISHTLVLSTDHQWTPRSERSPVGRKRSKEERAVNKGKQCKPTNHCSGKKRKKGKKKGLLLEEALADTLCHLCMSKQPT